MVDSDVARELVDSIGAKSGDVIQVGEVHGVLLQSDSSSKNIITIKKSDGYNVGVNVDESTKVSLIEKKIRKIPPVKEHIEFEGERVVVLSTGGTISSKIDYETGAAHAATTARELVDGNPWLKDKSIEAHPVCSIMSEDIHPRIWLDVAREAHKHLQREEVSGVVVTHGTDTMHFSSAALSFLLDLNKPVVFTGSQRSSDRPSSDAFMNLACAVRVAESEIPEVCLVMHDSSSDDKCAIHRGVRVRKMHTSKRDAFKSINENPIGYVTPMGDLDLCGNIREKKALAIYDNIEEKVGMLYAYPGITPRQFDVLIEDGCKGVVLAGTGLGHVPTKFVENNLLPSIKKARDEDIVVAMAPQCIYGGVHQYVYSNLRKLSNEGVVFCKDMLPEVAYAKLCCLLGGEKSFEKVRELMVSDIAGEISDRSVN